MVNTCIRPFIHRYSGTLAASTLDADPYLILDPDFFLIKINTLQKMPSLCFVGAYVSLYFCALNKSVISVFKNMIFW